MDIIVTPSPPYYRSVSGLLRNTKRTYVVLFSRKIKPISLKHLIQNLNDLSNIGNLFLEQMVDKMYPKTSEK